MTPRFRHDFSITSIEDAGRVRRADGGYTQRVILRAADVYDVDQLPGMVAVGCVVENYRVTYQEDHHRARLRLYRAAAARLRQLAVQALRDAD